MRWIWLAVWAWACPLQGGLLGGADVTPSCMMVTLKKIEFQKTSGSWLTHSEGAVSYDVGCVSPGQPVGTWAEGVGLTPGQYQAIRVTFARSVGFVGEGVHSGKTLRTNGGGGAVAYGAYRDVGEAGVDGGPPQLQYLKVPSGPGVAAALAAAGISDVGSDELRYTAPLSFSVFQGKYVTPSLRIDFDVKDALEVVSTGPGSGVVAAQVPKVRVRL